MARPGKSANSSANSVEFHFAARAAAATDGEDPASGAGRLAEDRGPRDCQPLGVDVSSVQPAPTSEARIAAIALHGRAWENDILLTPGTMALSVGAAIQLCVIVPQPAARDWIQRLFG